MQLNLILACIYFFYFLCKVFNDDKEKFEEFVKIFLILSIITGFCSSIQGACFRIAGSKVSCAELILGQFRTDFVRN